MMGHGSGDIATTVEQRALALIAAFGGKKEVSDGIKALSKARQEAEEAVSKAKAAQLALDERTAALEAREAAAAEFERRQAVKCGEHDRRVAEFNVNSRERSTALEERAAAIARDKKLLVAERDEFDEAAKKKQKELDDREVDITKKMAKAAETSLAANEALEDAEDLKAKYEARLRTLVELASGELELKEKI